MKVLILYISTKMNCKEAEEAIKRYMKNNLANLTVDTADILKCMKSVTDKLIVQDDIINSRNFRKLYSKIDDAEGVFDITELFNELFFQEVYKIITESQPDIIAYTHSLCLEVLKGLEKSGKLNLPVIDKVTN